MKFLSLLLPALLLSSTVPPERHVKWLLAVDKALDSQSVCEELQVLSEAPEADEEVNDVLKEILKTKCQ